jgi:hypothetical protein
MLMEKVWLWRLSSGDWLVKRLVSFLTDLHWSVRPSLPLDHRTV